MIYEKRREREKLAQRSVHRLERRYGTRASGNTDVSIIKHEACDRMEEGKRREGERAVLRFNLRGMKEDKCSQILAGRCLEFLRSDYNTVPSP